MTSDATRAHILCINHAPEILDLLRVLLEAEGYRVSTVPTAERNLDVLVELAPDLITIDYMWTTSDNEWTYLTLLRMDPRTRHIPIILCTGAIGQVMAMHAHLMSIGIRVVFKPFDINTLLEAVKVELEGPSTPEESASAHS